MTLTWLDFKNTCDNVTVAFEDLCRIFFKYRYVNDATVILNQRSNNPGIETDPVLIYGQKVGFQAKYFTGNISYTDILDSAEKVVKYYVGKIDRVILFCNKDISTEVEKYKKASKLLLDNNITIELCCNHNILDLINTDENYAPLKALFFNKITLTDKWFKEKLDRSLKELEPRYTHGFHVNEEQFQKHFDILFRNEKIIEYLHTLIDGAKRDIKYNEQKILKQKVETIIDNLIIPDRQNYEKVLSWYEQFESVKNEIQGVIYNLENKLDDVKNTEERRIIYNKLSPLNKLMEIIKRFDLVEDEHFRYINNNILIVEGEAGSGKSHLLGYEAEYNYHLDKYRSILLLGQKFIYEKMPQEQIMQILGIDASFNDFLLACEAKGALDGSITVIMIDAVNECQKYVIWKRYLGDIVDVVKKLKYVKLVCSVRTTYKQYIFSDEIQKEIAKGTISLVEVTGFKNNLSEAVPLFFNYYKIPITTAAFLKPNLKILYFCKHIVMLIVKVLV